MDPLSAELKELAKLSMVQRRKRSFAGGTEACELQSNKSKTNFNHPTQPENTAATVPTHTAGDKVQVEPINYEPTNDNILIDSSDSSDSDDLSGGSTEHLPPLSSPAPSGILSPILTSRLSVDESGHGTWPRKRSNASVRSPGVRFEEDPIMVRQKENGSRLAAASSTEWGEITDNGYIDDAGTSEKVRNHQRF